jgi:hypothetical protein
MARGLPPGNEKQQGAEPLHWPRPPPTHPSYATYRYWFAAAGRIFARFTLIVGAIP